jgi:hypothetical protein
MYPTSRHSLNERLFLIIPFKISSSCRKGGGIVIKKCVFKKVGAVESFTSSRILVLVLVPNDVFGIVIVLVPNIVFDILLVPSPQ